MTVGILQLLDERELRGVLAHELSHVVNRDILISSIAAAIGMSITFIARFGFFFGSDREGGGMSMLVAWILAPLAAMMIQMAVSRSREYQADESGAFLSKDPEALASALAQAGADLPPDPAPASVSPAEAHMFIVNPMASLARQGHQRPVLDPPAHGRPDRAPGGHQRADRRRRCARRRGRTAPSRSARGSRRSGSDHRAEHRVDVVHRGARVEEAEPRRPSRRSTRWAARRRSGRRRAASTRTRSRRAPSPTRR